VPGCSEADNDFLPAGCSDGTTATEETISGTADVGSDVDTGAGDLA
jgi:hypothetical protein